MLKKIVFNFKLNVILFLTPKPLPKVYPEVCRYVMKDYAMYDDLPNMEGFLNSFVVVK